MCANGKVRIFSRQNISENYKESLTVFEYSQINCFQLIFFSTFVTFLCFSRVWIFTCRLILLFWAIHLPQMLHWYFFLPGWLLICRSKSSLAILSLQITHLNPFWPMWICICLPNDLFSDILLSQMLHWYGFSPVWIHICLLRLLCWSPLYYRRHMRMAFHQYESPHMRY